MQLHHLGIACKDINKTLEGIKKLHGVVSTTNVVFDEKQQAYVQLVTLEDGTSLELISGNIVKGLLEKKVNLYHICYQVDDMATEIYKAKQADALVISMPKPSALFDGKLVAFLMFPYGLVEFLEVSN